MLPDPNFPVMQAITSSLDGKICLWDVADGLLVKTFDLGKPIHAIVRFLRLDLAVPCTLLLKRRAISCNFQGMMNERAHSLWASSLSIDRVSLKCQRYCLQY